MTTQFVHISGWAALMNGIIGVIGAVLLTHLTQNVPKVPLKNLIERLQPSGRCVASVFTQLFPFTS